MKYIDEFRDPGAVQRLLTSIHNRSSRPIRLMEFCGGHTHAILKFGLRQLLPPSIRLLSGPGCPVCVTASTDLDRAIAMAHLPDLILTTFGDMMRVPGSQGSLQDAKAQGADVRMVYSTLDALSIARANPDRQVIFLAIGFETTAPTVAAAVLQAQAEGLDNFSIFSLHKLTPPAMKAILEAGEVQLSGIIGPGHVTTVIGSNAWHFLPRDYGIPCAIAGFEPLDILQAVYALVDMVERGAPAVSNAYRRSVRPEGNLVAQQMMQQVFQVSAAEWRGLGSVTDSGLSLRSEYAAFDATRRFPVAVHSSLEPRGCLCGEVLRGVVEPPECPLFDGACTPEHPVGPCMVSSEGACAAYAQYGEA
ncbi:MAG: hydrogenase formation protein HypD [Chloroflexi bacterium]|nr:hydrogenase formation protein HypD [Chloroflexota bacterium]